MNKVAHQSLIDVNAVVFMVEALKWTLEDEHVCELVQKQSCPVIIAVNKVDLIAEKAKLLPFLQQLADSLPQAKIIPISVKKNMQIEAITNLISSYLPKSEFYFPREQIMNHSERFHIAEIIREKLMTLLDKELPYSLCVEIEKFERQNEIVHIDALIWAEREGQKCIIIGEKGNILKEVGSRARLDLEQFFGKKVFLKLWVKVKESWSDDARAVQSLGYFD